MKTIEERAREIAIEQGKDFCVEDFILGAQSEHEELTRWHDPKVELPDEGKLVLLKTTFGKGFELAEHEETGWWLPYDDEWEISDNQVLGWREIHE